MAEISKENVLHALRALLNYGLEDEQRHHDAHPDSGHIFQSYKLLYQLMRRLENNQLFLVSTETLEEITEKTIFAKDIALKETKDAEGKDWDSVYDDARQAGVYLSEIEEVIVEVMNGCKFEDAVFPAKNSQRPNTL